MSLLADDDEGGEAEGEGGYSLTLRRWIQAMQAKLARSHQLRAPNPQAELE
jgi:hypothetical protein